MISWLTYSFIAEHIDTPDTMINIKSFSRRYLIMPGMLAAISCVYHDLDVTPDCEGSDMALSIVSLQQASACDVADGSITVSAVGGVGSHTFSIGNEVYQADSIFKNLLPGTYTLYVKDANGCTVTQMASVNNAQSTLQLTVSVTQDTGCPTSNGTIVITATGGEEPYAYRINTNAYQSGSSFTGLAAGNYSVAVRDASGCPTSGNATVTRQGPGFAADIKPIITTKCAISGCHNGSRSPNLSTYTGVKNNASAVLSKVTSKAMPPSNSPAGALTQQQISLITCWVNDGALNN
jgi:hypothetical protein